MPSAKLVLPTTRLHAAWLEARDEWGRGVHQDGSGLRADDDADTAEGFATWVRRLRQQSDPAVPVGPGRVHATYWWIVSSDDGAEAAHADCMLLGAISLRHHLNDDLLHRGGHIGYGIRPSARGQGLATWALGAVLEPARALGLERVLVTCNDDNAASARTIERNGGVLEDVRDHELGRFRRYWISL